MRIVCFSDTHGYHKKVQIPHGDMLIFAGDYIIHRMTNGVMDRSREMIDTIAFNKWLGKFHHKRKLFICGNHDICFEDNHNLAKAEITNATYLQDSMVEVEGLKIWGSPITPYFNGWAFNRHPGPEIQRHWDMIPDDIDILVTHGPPAGILDETDDKIKVGSVELKERIKDLKNLKLHVFGHIHPAWGREERDGVIYVNCSKGYHHLRQNKPPISVEI